MKTINEYLNSVNEGKYGPTGKEALTKLNSKECKKYQEILDKYNDRGKTELKKYFHDDWSKLYLQFPQVNDGYSRRLCKHLEYDDILVSFPNTVYYYVINRDLFFGFEVTYEMGSGGPSTTYVSGEKMHKNTDIFGAKGAKFFYDLIKELNPNTKYKLEDLKAE